MSGGRPTLATVDLSALRSNFELARRLASGREIIAVVKADAYGHGAVHVSRTLCAAGCRQLAVVTVPEAAELRESGIDAALLVMGGVHDEAEARRCCELRLTPVIHDAGGLTLLAVAARGASGPIPVLVEVDTAMRRMGVPPEHAAELLCAVAGEPGVELAGVFTHLACADDPDPSFSLEQLARFRDVLADAEARGVEVPGVHIANSAGLLAGGAFADALPATSAVRPGLMLYGARPADHFDAADALRPVMSVRSRIVAIRDLRPGESVGYGASYRTSRATRVATLPLGYADGVLRSLGNRGEVWLGGVRRPIVGRVSMDYITIDVGGALAEEMPAAAVAVGDEATFFGTAEDGGDVSAGISVDEVAKAAGTIAYELLIRVGERVPRRFIDTN